MFDDTCCASSLTAYGSDRLASKLPVMCCLLLTGLLSLPSLLARVCSFVSLAETGTQSFVCCLNHLSVECDECRAKSTLPIGVRSPSLKKTLAMLYWHIPCRIYVQVCNAKFEDCTFCMKASMSRSVVVTVFLLPCLWSISCCLCNLGIAGVQWWTRAC